MGISTSTIEKSGAWIRGNVDRSPSHVCRMTNQPTFQALAAATSHDARPSDALVGVPFSRHCEQIALPTPGPLLTSLPHVRHKLKTQPQAFSLVSTIFAISSRNQDSGPASIH